ncbi:UNVERIFIED_CONTAM: nicotinamide-nucleotide amidase [Williamsia faeni]
MTADPLAGEPARRLVAELTRRGQSVATSESLTAGLLSAMIAGIPGASAVLRGGLIVYATDLKADLAGVRAGTLEQYGPVAGQTAEELAIGAAQRCGATYGISLTGVAGPDPQDGKAPGTVFCGLARARSGTATENAGFDTKVVGMSLQGDRWDIRLMSCTRSIGELLDWLA